MSIETKEDLEVQALVDIVVERARKAGMNNISDKHMDEIYYTLLGEYQRDGYDKAVHYAKTVRFNPELLKKTAEKEALNAERNEINV